MASIFAINDTFSHENGDILKNAYASKHNVGGTLQ